MAETNRDWGKVLVVGGAGFVGSNLCGQLLTENTESLVIVDNLLSADPANLPKDPRVDFRLGSVADDRLLAGLPLAFDHVFHLATYHGNQSSMADPIADHDNNTVTTLKLCERLKDMTGLRSVVYASAGCTVAEKTFEHAEATTEESPISLWYDSPYQISKIIGELYGNYYHTRFGLPFIKARFQNVYGPGEILGAGRWRGTPATVWRNVTPTFIYKALMDGALPVDNGGIATRDFIFVDDIVEGLMACAQRGTAGGVYNVASGVETSILELAKLVNEVTGNTTPIDYQPPRDWDRSGKRYGSTEKAERDLGFRAKIDLRDGLERTVAWTREHLPMVERCIEQHRPLMEAS